MPEEPTHDETETQPADPDAFVEEDTGVSKAIRIERLSDTTAAPPPPYTEAYAPPPMGAAGPVPRRGGCGCWITALLALLLAAGLVVVGLFLPPVSLYQRLFGPQYVMLSPGQNGLAVSGLRLVLDPADTGREFGIALNNASVENYTASGQTLEWAGGARSALPSYLALQSPVYHFDTTGTAPGVMTLELDLPEGNADRDYLDLYGWYADANAWRFIPAQPNTEGRLSATVDALPEQVGLFRTTAVDPTILTTVEITQSLSSSVGQVSTIVAPAGLQPGANGALVGSLAPGFRLNAGYRVMPVIRNFLDPRALDPETATTIISSRALRDDHAEQITALAANGGFSGVFIDYRDLPDVQRENFSAFIERLSASLRPFNLQLGVVVPPARNVERRWETGAYDWRAIGQSADYVVVNFELNPATFAPGENQLVEAMLRWGVGEVSRHKLLAGLSALSIRETNGSFTSVAYDEALTPLGNVNVLTETQGPVIPGTPIRARLDGLEAVPGVDTTTRTPYIEYLNTDGSRASRMWLTSGDALLFRMQQAAAFALGGVALSDLAAPGVMIDVLETVQQYSLGLPVSAEPRELALRWRVEDASGVVSEVTTSLNEELVVTLEAVEGNFAINVEVVDGGTPRPRSGAAVAIFNPTSTPTPLPTATATPPPTTTPTLEPIIPTQPASSGVSNPPPNSGPVVPPGPGRIAAGFEYGGHVTSTHSDVATGAMQQAGMTWMKIQIRYFPGRNPGDVASIINDARARGFKILIGTVGSPNDLAAGGGSYIQQFAQFLGGVASLGPDAIEVWNEPNLSREWPAGQISGANYVAMLGSAYQAIKQANPGVMVIAGAPAPTGAENAFPGEVVNDDNFLRQMVDAGAMQYMDCMGLHYNEGVVSPTQTSGDFRDNYYTRYLLTMIDVYWNITGGQKPLCITELGYLTAEGYGGLSDFWGWARSTTVAQQSAWLAEAVALASTSGKVRLLIIWNIDFTRFDANDPQGGYAIVRPGGGCPACAAIAGAR
jgi:hypothetical protein